jgi:hypothetical protein
MPEYTEWQAHKYDPGYFTGGRIAGFVWRVRPQRLGVLFLLTGVFAAVALSWVSEFQEVWSQGLFLALVAFLYLAAAFLVLRRADTKNGQRRRG